MRFGVLGEIAVWTSDGEPVTVPGLKVRGLLADLLVHEGRPVSADRLIEDLWGDEPPGNALGALQTKVSQLRRALEAAEPGGRALVESGDAGYRLRTSAESIDAVRFTALLGRSRAQREPARRAATLTEALSLWRGSPYADFGDERFVRQAAERLNDQYLAALEELAEARLELGEHHLLAGELADLVARHPWRERLRAAHLRALYGSGRQRDALAAYEQFRRQLRDELGIDPGQELAELHRAILRQDPALQPAAPPPNPARTNLPAPLSPGPYGGLIGRDEAVEAVRERLTNGRLVTLTGLGGVGKTRLALEAARMLADTFPAGVWLVELAGQPHCGDPATCTEIVDLVAATLEIRDDSPPGDRPREPMDRLVAALRDRKMLLLLDNCEHVVEPIAQLTEMLLGAAADLRILATSREPLGIAGEVVFPVPPLALPEPGATAEQIVEAPAVRLFVARARAIEPGFAVDREDTDVIATICRRLDGVPLALELAASRLPVVDPSELAARLDDRFRLLSSGRRTAPPRQQGLRAMIDWSWELLPPPERAVLRRLAVFADGATLATAEQVCSGGQVAPDDLLDVLARLIDRSLVMVRHGESPRRYRLPETVAAYGLEQLDSAGELAITRRRYAACFARLAERTAGRLRGHDQSRVLGELDAENGNLRAALDVAATDGYARAGLTLATSLTWYRLLRGRFGELGRSLRTALDIVPTSEEEVAPDALRRHADMWLVALATRDGDPTAPRQRVLESYPDADGPDRAFAQWLFASMMLGSGDPGEAAVLVNAALAAFRAHGDRWGIAAACATRADLALVLRSDLSAAERDCEVSRSLFGQLGDRWGQVHPTSLLGSLAEIRGDYDRAEAWHREALRIAEHLRLWTLVSRQLAHLGRLALLRGDHDEAVAWHERALRVAQEQSSRSAAAFAGTGLALAARRRGDLDAAEARQRDLLQWNRHAGYLPGCALALAELGFIAEHRGDAALAERRHRESLDAARATGDQRAVALALEGLAGAASLDGDHRRAARLLGAAGALREAAGAPLPAGEQHDVRRITARVREALGGEELAAEMSRGLRLDLDEPGLDGVGKPTVSSR
ncbi:BTAD domain-containing putative transcriptional regulator [Micromonospora sp. C28SCA-DRY-2]|uniref:BTAD domain-containing putative transcriptional regulator n=1 Tax=Micromonospora sp. C28SCA-DRY-2 TaxID=3059522 RepID=UPI0026765025|nr:BTAD domain-containing putative transcriptional regulator [Micromonospora sp. C28SCA-DRY-2]MDO3700190.1 BTAD domain-containing putative transcriptional regulator [Micromonospora sp. C28SCA-DRY-2]